MCCRLLVLPVLQRGISDSGFETRKLAEPTGRKVWIKASECDIGNERVFLLKSVTLAVVSLKVASDVSSPIRGRSFVPSPSLPVERLRPHFCSLNDVLGSCSIDRGVKKRFLKKCDCAFSRHTEPKRGRD